MLFDQLTAPDVRATDRWSRKASAALSLAVIMGLVVALGACSYDPWRQEGTWRPSPANAENLREMIAQPSDLKSGEPATATRAAPAAGAVNALLTGSGPSLSGGEGAGGNGLSPSGSTASSGMAAGGSY